ERSPGSGGSWRGGAAPCPCSARAPPCAPDFARTGPDRAATPASESRRDAWTRLYKNDCRRASSAVDRFHRRDPAVVEGRPGFAGAARVSGGLGAWGPFAAPHPLIAQGGRIG